MLSSLSSRVDNLSDGIYCDQCIDCKSYVGHMITKDDQLIFKCFECKKRYQKDFNKDLYILSIYPYIKSIYLGMSILDISKTLMYELWCNYIKPKYQNNSKLSYMDTESLLFKLKLKIFFKDIADNVKRSFAIIC